MSTRIGPKVNLTDCVLYLDSSNPTSYGGVGSVWYDCSGYGNHFTLQNTPTYNGSSLTFNANGGNQYAVCTNTSCGNFGTDSFSIEIVYNYVNTSDLYSSVIHKRARVTNIQWGDPGYHWNPKGSLYIGDGAGAATTGQLLSILGNATINPQTPTPNTTIYEILTVNRNGLEVTGSLYTNTIKQSDNLQYTYTNGGNINNSLATRLFYSYGEADFITGSIYTVRMYTRCLQLNEIQNNYQIYRNYYNF